MDVRFFENAAEFRAWLAENHASAQELWMGYYKKASGKGGLSYREALDEALCFGWIDGVRRTLDAERHVQRWTPRRSRSTWSNINVNRYRELEATGRVAPAGRAAFAARTEENTGIYSFEQAQVELGAAFERRFREDTGAWAYWEGCPPGYRRTSTFWVVSAKREETREKRFLELLECSRRHERIPLLRRGSAR